MCQRSPDDLAGFSWNLPTIIENYESLKLAVFFYVHSSVLKLDSMIWIIESLFLEGEHLQTRQDSVKLSLNFSLDFELSCVEIWWYEFFRRSNKLYINDSLHATTESKIFWDVIQ